MAACRRRPDVRPNEPAAAPTAATSTPPREARPDAETAAIDREPNRTDSDARTRARAVLVEPIRFPFDRSDLSSDARLALDAKLDELRADGSLRIVIEGHADDRGSDEYNMALGMRRAAAARRYLVQHGIDPERVDITSAGEERPVCRDPDEACWQQNRRAEFAVAN